MNTIETDVAIIGAGTAGLNARREVERAGKRWLLIEAGPYGTTCARVGCMPSKLLIAAAEIARNARKGSDFGIQIESDAVRIDGPQVLARLRSERDRFVQGVVDDVSSLPREQRIRGFARFIGPNELQVGNHTRVRANAIVIATGSMPRIPEMLRVVSDGLHTNQTIFELPDLPKTLAVFGTGPLGLELGQAFDALGVHVRFFNPEDQVGPFSDPEVARRFRETLQRDALLSVGISDIRLEALELGFRIHYRQASGQMEVEDVERVLVAAGRMPRVDRLDLEKAGVELDRQGTPTFDPATMQCGKQPIFIAGDVTGERQLLHAAMREGCIAGANAALYPDLRNREVGKPLTIGFTHPQVAIVGSRYADLNARDLVVGEASYEDQGRARVHAENKGFARLYFDRTSQVFLGAELFAPNAEHLAHTLAWSAESQLDIHRMMQMPYYHPTLEEGVRTAVLDAASQFGLNRGCAPDVLGEAAGA